MRKPWLFNSGAAGPPPFDPATLSLDAWYPASFGGVPWSPVASAGTSGSNGTLVSGGTAPSVGTAVNSLDPAAFNGTTQSLVANTAAMTDMITAAAMTLIVLFKAAGGVAIATDFYDDPLLAGDAGGNLGIVYTTSGVRAGCYSGGSNQTTSIALATGNWALCAMRYNGTNVKCRVSQVSGTTDATPVASGTPSVGAALFVGKNYAAAKRIQGDVLEIMTSKTVLSDADLVNLVSYANARYGLGLT